MVGIEDSWCYVKSLVAAGHCVSQSHNCWRFSWTSLKTTVRHPKAWLVPFANANCKLVVQ